MQKKSEVAMRDVQTGSRWGHVRALLGLAALLVLVQCRTDSSGTTVHPRTRARAVDAFGSAGALVERLSDGQFQFQAGPKPPTRVGEQLTLPFPPPQKPKTGPSAVTAPPLKVLRTQPHGKVGLQNAVTVSFNQAMIPLASLSDLRKLPAPLLVKPVLTGKHRWLGTRTLSLEVTSRLPYSTRFTAWVPSGTVAESGKRLERKHEWSFETPRLEIQQSLPSRWEYHAVPTTAIALLFNQKVDVEKVFAAMNLTGAGAPKLRLVPRSQWKKLGPYGVAATRWEKGRVMVVKPVRALRKATRYTLQIRGGLTAGEGPLPTQSALSRSFTTYGPLRVEELRCGYGSQVCRPKTSKWLRFSNRIKSADPKGLVTIRPAVEEYDVNCSWRHCYLRGTFKPQTKYTVTVRGGLEDVYEQQLGKQWSGSFWVGDAYPELNLPVSGVEGTTETKGNRTLLVRSINIKGVTASAVRVQPRHAAVALFTAERRWHWKYRKHSMVADIPGQRLSQPLTLNRKSNKWRRSGVPLDIGLPKGKPGIVFVELYAPDLLKASRYANPYRRMLLQATDLGLTVRYDVDRLLVLVTGLRSGQPLPGVEVKSYSKDGKELAEARTDARGIATLPGPRKLKQKGPQVLVAVQGDDAAFVRVQGGEQGGWVSGYQPYSRIPPIRQLRSHLYTERSPYRPGETVRLTGVLRTEDTRVGGGIEPLRGKGLKVKYWIRDARYQLVVKAKELSVDADGVFRLDYQIPEGASLGGWHFRGTVMGSQVGDGQSVYHYFQVLHYRTPEYKVSVKVRGEPYFFGDAMQGAIQGSYYHGTAMADAPVKWTLRRSVGAFQPPHHGSFRFGELQDWAWRWRYNRGFRGGRYGSYYTSGHQDGGIIAKGEAKLDKQGLFKLSRQLAFWKKPKDRPNHGPGTVGAFTLEAEVFDKNRQAIAGRKAMTVHPAAVYVGLRMKKALVRAGQDSTVQVVVADLKGARQVGSRVKLVATSQVNKRKAKKVRGVWQFEYTLVEKVVGGCSVTTAKQVQGCKIRLPKAGYYRVQGETTDSKGRKTRTVIGVYAVGKRYTPWKQNNRNRIELISDKQQYKPGETARILIKSPFRQALGLLTVERNGIKSYRLIRVQGSVHVEQVQVGAQDLPNLHVSVALLRGRVKIKGAAGAKDLGRPMFAAGSKSLSVDIAAKKLHVTVAAEPGTARPGAETQLTVTVKDAAGQPARARLAVMIVDEGVLSLLGFRVPDPVTIFHSYKSAQAALRDGRAELLRQEKDFKKVKTRTRNLHSYRRRGGMYKRSKMLLGGLMLRQKGAGGGAMPSGSSAETTVAKAPPAPPSERDSFSDSDGVPDATDKESGGSGRRTALVFKTRAKFASTAYFNAEAKTDSTGRAVLSVKLPENLTTFRITAVALDQQQPDRFGRGEGRVTVRRPL
ncbi:MAG: MG2 domain-containing protein, partial [bacterium]